MIAHLESCVISPTSLHIEFIKVIQEQLFDVTTRLVDGVIFLWRLFNRAVIFVVQEKHRKVRIFM